ncbi:MAG: VTT domain-containing protein [Acutalibacteraceae bacterium]|nr:VTT domain-containing protein [Acutalibacteraceae bacterium]
MSSFIEFWDTLLHIDRILDSLVTDYPIWSYLILGFVVFAETAFVITSFLPSDAVLFAACSLMMVQKSFNPFILIPLFYGCALLGDSVNFAIGRFLRKEVNKTGKILFIKKQSLEKVNKIFDKSGSTAIICARFVPLLRSLVPFVTGVSKKEYRWFVKRNAIGVGIWTTLFCSLGVFFGNFQFVKNHFGLVAIGICFLTIFTAFISLTVKKLILERKNKKEEK